MLSDWDNARLFNQLVRPSLTGERRENPVVLFVGGQPGAGKSTVQSAILQRLGRQDAFPLDGDDIVALHPRYADLGRGNDITSAFLAGEDLKSRWWNRSARLLRAQRLDIVVSAPLGGPDWPLARFAEFRRAGYRVGAAFVATHEAMSLQGIVNRYHRARQPDQVGYGRWVAPEIHDQAYSRVLDTMAAIDRQQAVDIVYVARRTGEVLHINESGPQGWNLGAATSQAVTAERNRPWTLEESARFLQTQGRLRTEMTTERTPLLNSIEQRAIPVINPLAVHDDGQFAARKTEVVQLLHRAQEDLKAAEARADALRARTQDRSERSPSRRPPGSRSAAGRASPYAGLDAQRAASGRRGDRGRPAAARRERAETDRGHLHRAAAPKRARPKTAASRDARPDEPAGPGRCSTGSVGRTKRRPADHRPAAIRPRPEAVKELGCPH
ncbi:zeta toxin family protein [Streptomyces sp. NPDC058486]|uniref:zeta toxin family protein n=1 Tax=unclassified Streptomyces TaxID=2593676 RepID=UPI003652DB52